MNPYDRFYAAAPQQSQATDVSPAQDDGIEQAMLREMMAREAEAPTAKPQSRRATPRADLKADVDFSSDTNFFSGFSTDIADGGLFLATLNVLPVGSVVSVKFSLPTGAQIQATGEVRWVRALDERSPETYPGMGIRFVELAPESKDAIKVFVSQREPMFFPD